VAVIVVDLELLPIAAADGAPAALQGDEGVTLGGREPVGLLPDRNAAIARPQDELARSWRPVPCRAHSAHPSGVEGVCNGLAGLWERVEGFEHDRAQRDPVGLGGEVAGRRSRVPDVDLGSEGEAILPRVAGAAGESTDAEGGDQLVEGIAVGRHGGQGFPRDVVPVAAYRVVGQAEIPGHARRGAPGTQQGVDDARRW
jgi:hypothetical protein